MQNRWDIPLSRETIEKLLHEKSELKLSNQDLSYADLSYLNLSGADLRGASLYKANVGGALLNAANLNGVDGVQANFDEAILLNANLQNMRLIGASLIEANLTNADLRSADLRDADLRWADFSNARLNKSDLRGIKLEKTIVTGVHLDSSQRNYLADKDVIGLETAIVIEILLPPILDKLQSLYEFLDPPDVVDFIMANKSLISLLEEAYEPIKNYFPQSRLYLEVLIDPEISNRTELSIVIDPNCSPQEALQSLKQLYTNWWLSKKRQAHHRLSFNIEHKGLDNA